MPPDPVHSARSRHARTCHKFGTDSPEAQETKRELVAAKLVREIASATSEPPTLTTEQRQRIANLLTAPGGVA